MTALVTLVLLTSELPDPGRLSTITLAGGLGAFVGALIAYVRRLPSGRAGDATRTGTVWGFGVGITVWTVALAIDRL